ncbi:hypothetical protein CMV_016744 [Castanea mollissima]|uniref:UDP-glucuronosyl/UDP-glucosyltransferase n=1 Tax=Castanea mollissima TaxID=60419 RepID=A0A8J4R3E5_9ROSI|nr:hypothetical protein CMV_016744 [Castanea mollissima]
MAGRRMESDMERITIAERDVNISNHDRLWLRQRDRSVVSFNGGGNVSLSLQPPSRFNSNAAVSLTIRLKALILNVFYSLLNSLNAALDLAIKLKNSILEAIYHRLNGNEALSFIEAFHALLGDLALFPTALIGLHFQVLGVSPLHTHFAIILLFFMATIVHRIAYTEIKLRPQDVGNSSKQLLNHFLQGNKKTMGTSLNKTNKNEQAKRSVVVRTYPAESHINPLQFAKRLASKGLKATLATTHYTVKSIHATTVGVEPIPDGYDEGGYRQTPSTEAYLESFKSVGSKTLSELISKFKDSDSPVNCIVYDSLLPWALDVARQFGICGAVFLTNSASVCSM